MVATEQEAIREWVWIVGAQCPEREWLCSNYDTWEKNPHYTGEPGRHPEDYDYEVEGLDGDAPNNDRMWT